MTGQREVRSHSFGMDMELGNGVLSVLNEDGLNAHYGADAETGRGLRAVAFDVAVTNLAKVSDILANSGVESRRIGKRLIVDPAPGQGSILAFME